MKRTLRQKLYAEKLKIQRWLEKAIGGMEPRENGPEFSIETVHYELAERTRAISAGGIGVIHQMVSG